LLQSGVELEEHDLGKERLTAEQLDALIGPRNYLEFLNPRNELYRQQQMKEHPPARDAALKLIAQEPNLIRRPIVIRGEKMVLGYDEEGLKRLAE
jgi:arsenate reductase-like glutaredoxin family protein